MTMKKEQDEAARLGGESEERMWTWFNVNSFHHGMEVLKDTWKAQDAHYLPLLAQRDAEITALMEKCVEKDFEILSLNKKLTALREKLEKLPDIFSVIERVEESKRRLEILWEDYHNNRRCHDDRIGGLERSVKSIEDKLEPVTACIDPGIYNHPTNKAYQPPVSSRPAWMDEDGKIDWPAIPEGEKLIVEKIKGRWTYTKLA